MSKPKLQKHQTDVTTAGTTIRLLFVNDLHSGHEVGLWPEGQMVDHQGKPYQINDTQRILLAHWKSLLAEVREDIKPDILFVNGDLMDGEQRHSLGREGINLLPAQQKAAIKLLEPLVGTVKETYIVRGTPYHDGARGMDIEPISTALGAIGPNPDWHTWDLLDLEIRDSVVINLQHAISIASGFYRATPLDREGIYSALAGKEGMAPKADIVARAHAHVYVRVEHPTKHIFIVPCWQGQTEYMRRHSAYRMFPNIGAVVVDIDPKEKVRGRDPVIRLQKLLYPLAAREPWKSQV